jgi:nicotinamide riboside transporter PnuC
MDDVLREWLLQRTWVDVAEAVFVLMSIVGQHFISEQNKAGFYYWGAGNIVAIGMFAFTGRWLTACLYLHFLWKCRTGVSKWSQLQASRPPACRCQAQFESSSKTAVPSASSAA